MSTSVNEVWAALALGAVSSVGLLLGVIAGALSRIPHRRIAIAMSVGAGLLLAGVSLKVTANAIRLAGPIAVALSLLLGAAAFSASNALSLGSVPRIANAVASVFSSLPSRNSLAVE
jgi:hypothetical protein